MRNNNLQEHLENVFVCKTDGYENKMFSLIEREENVFHLLRQMITSASTEIKCFHPLKQMNTFNLTMNNNLHG